jgi:hypothetical protein
MSKDSSNKRPLSDEPEPEACKKAATLATPFEAYSDKLEAFMKANSFIDQVFIKGISLDDGQEEETSTYTVKQLADLRFVLLTEASVTIFKDAEKLLLGDQYEESCFWFNTSYSYEVKASLETMKKILFRKKPAKKLQHLFAYTFFLKKHNFWMRDNEGDMGKFTKSLARLWKNLLKKSDEELGWDEAYSKPGILELLARFKEHCEDETLTAYPMPFNYN